jgi:orotate phosphoribosyltransferase
MHVIPTQEEVVRILRDTGALREGHFIYPNGLHSNEYVQVPLALRHYQHARTLSVGLSRLLRADPEIRAMLSALSIVSPAVGGVPVAYGVCQALEARQVYWAEDSPRGQLRLRQFIQPVKDEPIVLVDDILHSGGRLSRLKALIEGFGAVVVAIAVVVYQPDPQTHDFGSLPIRHLARLEASSFTDAASCELCRKSQPAEEVWI